MAIEKITIISNLPVFNFLTIWRKDIIAFEKNGKCAINLKEIFGLVTFASVADQ